MIIRTVREVTKTTEERAEDMNDMRTGTEVLETEMLRSLTGTKRTLVTITTRMRNLMPTMTLNTKARALKILNWSLKASQPPKKSIRILSNLLGAFQLKELE